MCNWFVMWLWLKKFKFNAFGDLFQAIPDTDSIKDLTKPYTCRIGIVYGSEHEMKFVRGFPHGKLTIFDDKLVVKFSSRKTCSFNKEMVLSLKTGKYVWSKGVRIHHNADDYDEYILIRSLSLTKMIKKLEQYGWGPVEEVKR